MKKIIVIVIFMLVVGLIASGIVFYVQKHKQPLTVEDVLPSDAVFYARMIDLEKNIQDFLSTEFVKSFKQIDFEAAMKEIGAKEQELLFYRGIAQQVISEQNTIILSKLFGREVAVAFYSGKNLKGASNMERMIEAASNFSFVTRLSPEVRFVEVLTAAASKVNPQITETIEDYKGKMIHQIDVEGFFVKIGYVRFGELLVFGIGDTAAKRAIDVVEDKEQALSNDPVFLGTIEHRLDGAEKAGFLNYGMFVDRMKEPLFSALNKGSAKNAIVQQQIEKGFENSEGFEVLSFSAKYDADILGRFDVSFDAEKFSAEVKKLYQFSAQENRSSSFAPRTALFYSWNAMMGMRFYWENLKEQMRQKADDDNDKAEAWIPLSGGTILGVDVEELISLLTNEFGWYFMGVEMTEVMPLPKGVFFLGVSNMDQTKAFIQQALGQNSILRVSMENYKDVDIGYIEKIPFIQGLEPAYCVLNNYLIISSHRQTLKEVIDTDAGENESLKEHDVFVEGKYGFSQPGNALFLLEISRIVAEVRKVLEWANEWADVQYARHQAFKAGAEKRLEDVRKQIIEKQTELEEMESRLLKHEEKKETLVVSPEELEEIEKELERKRKFQKSVGKVLEKLKYEEATMLAAQEDEGQRLTEEGMERLEEVQAEIEKRQARAEELDKDVDMIIAKKQDFESIDQRREELMLKIGESETVFAEVRGKMKGLEEMQSELEETVRAYDRANIPTPEQRKTVLNGIINPLLEALTHIDRVGAKVKIMEGRIRSEFFVEIE